MKQTMVSVVSLACALLAGCTIMGGAQSWDAPQRMRIGCQMWGVKEFWEKDPEKGFAEVFPKLRAMGYEGVQSMAFWKINPDRLESMLKANGLALVDMPVNFEHIEVRTSKAPWRSAAGSGWTSSISRGSRVRPPTNGANSADGSLPPERDWHPTASRSATTTTFTSSPSRCRANIRRTS